MEKVVHLSIDPSPTSHNSERWSCGLVRHRHVLVAYVGSAHTRPILAICDHSLLYVIWSFGHAIIFRSFFEP